MFTVYVLYSEKFDKIYIGYTSDVANRLFSHNSLGKKGYTVKFRPWIILWSEDFSDKGQAIIRERQLKTGAGREFIWRKVIEFKGQRQDNLQN